MKSIFGLLFVLIFSLQTDAEAVFANGSAEEIFNALLRLVNASGL